MTYRSEPATTGPRRRRPLCALLAVSNASAGTAGVVVPLPTTGSSTTTLVEGLLGERPLGERPLAKDPQAKDPSTVTARTGGLPIDQRPVDRRKPDRPGWTGRRP